MRKIFSITQEEADEIIRLVSNGEKTIHQSAKEYRISPSTLILKIKQYYPDMVLKGLFRSKNVNHNYFDKLNEENSYFLGLIFTDGSIEHVKGKQIKIEIELQESDKHILDSLCKCLDSKSKVRPRKKIRNENCKLMYRFTICSDRIGEKLAEFGIVPRKTRTIRIPEIFFQREDLFWHFLRGVFDGDGCIYVSRKKSHKKYFKCNFYGNEFKCKQLADFLKERYNLTSGNFHRSAKGRNGFCLTLASGNKQVQKIYSLLYKNAQFFFKRKHDKFLACFLEEGLVPPIILSETLQGSQSQVPFEISLKPNFQPS